jgi:hypothetical protein
VAAIHVAEMLCTAHLVTAEERHAFRVWWQEKEKEEDRKRKTQQLAVLARELGYECVNPNL